MTVAALIPAAGFGRRMRGVDKHLQPIDGEPLLRRVVRRCLAATDLVLVCVPNLVHPRALALHNLDVHLIPVPEAVEGMAASIRTGVGALPKTTTGVMVCPGDMPDLSKDDFLRIINAFLVEPHLILRATAKDGTPGHPVIFPAWSFPDLAQVQGDIGARDLLQKHAGHLRHIPLPGIHATTDLDTPEAWDAWLQSRKLP